MYACLHNLHISVVIWVIVNIWSLALEFGFSLNPPAVHIVPDSLSGQRLFPSVSSLHTFPPQVTEIRGGWSPWSSTWYWSLTVNIFHAVIPIASTDEDVKGTSAFLLYHRSPFMQNNSKIFFREGFNIFLNNRR